jgi:hypothetical protein
MSIYWQATISLIPQPMHFINRFEAIIPNLLRKSLLTQANAMKQVFKGRYSAWTYAGCFDFSKVQLQLCILFEGLSVYVLLYLTVWCFSKGRIFESSPNRKTLCIKEYCGSSEIYQTPNCHHAINVPILLC